MTLSAGTRLGPYEILASVGAGGMGEVRLRNDPTRHYDVSADGQRFLVNMPLGEETSLPITLVQNWTVLLRQGK